MEPGEPTEAREYALETAHKTLQVGRVLAAVMIPGFLYMVFADHMIGTPYVLPWRLSALIPALAFTALSFGWLQTHPRWVIPAHCSLLLGMMVNIVGVVFSVFSRRPEQSGTEHALMAGLVLIIFIVFIFAAGARRYVGAITVAPMVGLVVAFGLNGALEEYEWSYLVNPLMAIVAVMVGGILQDRMVRSEFHMRRLAEERHVALETTVAEVARVNSKLTAEIDARNKLEEQLRQRAAELRDANARLQIEVAEHKVTAAKMERFMAELKRSNDELQQFANVVSHDLRAPLSTISGFVELLGLRLTALDVRDAEAEEYARRTTNGVRRMYGMIEALLGYARLESKAGTPRAVNLNAVFEEVLLNLGADIEASRAVVLVPPLPEVWADPNHMVQLFQNLIGNAIKYAREGARPQIEVSCCSDGEWNRFAVKDNGIGFSPEHAERIFGIFFRIDPHGGRDGVGIGLAICKKIVDRLGGRIWAESVVGAGSTFFVNLPVLRLRAPGA